MSTTSTQSSSGGCGFVGLLQIAFIVLKLCHVISWTWPVVLLPLIISCGILVLVLAGFAVFMAVKR